MEVHLSEHEISGKYERFGCMPPTFLDAESRMRVLFVRRDGDDRKDQPPQVKSSVVHANMMRISDQVIHSVRIHLASNQVSPKDGASRCCSPLNERCNVIRFEACIRI
jgi:hypothetical protein